MQQMNRPSSFCRNAIAYLKAVAPDTADAVSLSEQDSPVMRDLGNGLLVSYVVDEGKSFSYVQNCHLAEAGIDLTKLHEYGLTNLSQIADENLKVQEYGSVYAIFADGNFEASFILLEDLWSRKLSALVQNEFVVAIPARDVLAFCDASSSEGIAELKNIVSRVSGGDHLLSSSLYRRRGSEWAAYAA